MKRSIRPLLAVLAVLVLLPAGATAGDRSGSAQRALADAVALFGNGPGTAAAHARGASDVLRRLALAVPDLKRSERRLAHRILARPTEPNDRGGDYFGAEAAGSPVCDSNLCVHWGRAAKHAPDPGDSDGNGAPDYAEEVLSAGARSYSVENDLLGWRDAKSDGTRGARGGRGGAGQVDIYLVELGRNLFGYASPDPGQGGRSRSGYLVVDNDYKGFGGAPLDLMRVTIAHEYNHILQFGYDVAQDGWMFESTATWVEEMVYPAIDDYLNFVSDFAKAPFKPMAEPERRATKLYGSAMWNHWLTAATGADTIRSAWAGSRKVKPRAFAVAAYDRAIGEAGGGSFSRQFAAFAAASAEWNTDPAFPDAGRYPEVQRTATLRKGKRIRLDHTAYRLYRVKGRGEVKLKLRAQRKTRAAVALVGVPTAGGAAEVELAYLARGGRASVELAAIERFARVTAVAINADGRVRGRSRDYTRDGRRFKLTLKR